MQNSVMGTVKDVVLYYSKRDNEELVRDALIQRIIVIIISLLPFKLDDARFPVQFSLTIIICCCVLDSELPCDVHEKR